MSNSFKKFSFKSGVNKRSSEKPKAKSNAEAQKFLENLVKDVGRKDESYTVDTEGDAQNVQYGKPNRHETPQYQRYSSRILGLTPRYRIRYDKAEFKNRDVTLDDIQLEDRARPDYGSIHPNPQKLNSSLELRDTEIDYMSIELAETPIPDNLLKERSRIQAEAEADPRNDDLWLQLVDIQQKIYRGKAQSTVKSVFLRALELNPGSPRMIMGYMMCVRVSPEDRAKKWLGFAIQNPQNSQLWIGLLEACFDNSRLGFLGCYRFMETDIALFKLLHAKLVQLGTCMEIVYVRVVFRLCLILQDAGYSEEAIGLIQALIEFNLFCPQDIDDTMESFREFWRSGCARVGDNGALGWCNTKPDSPVYLEPNDKYDPRYQFPQRPVLVDNEKDMFSVILTQSLDKVEKVSSPDAIAELLWSSMSILGLDVPWDGQNYNSALRSNKVPQQNIVNILKLVCESSVPVEFCTWALKYLSHADPEAFEATAKSLLGRYQSAILWGVYAELAPNPKVFDLVIMRSPALIKEDTATSVQLANKLFIVHLKKRKELMKPPNVECNLESEHTVIYTISREYYFASKKNPLEWSTETKMIIERYWSSQHKQGFHRSMLFILDLFEYHYRIHQQPGFLIMKDWETHLTKTLNCRSWSYARDDVFIHLRTFQKLFGRLKLGLKEVSLLDDSKYRISWLLHLRESGELDTRAFTVALTNTLFIYPRDLYAIWETFFDHEKDKHGNSAAISVLYRSLSRGCSWNNFMLTRRFEVSGVQMDVLNEMCAERDLRYQSGGTYS